MAITLTDNITEANLITHDGLFHANDIMAIIILKKFITKTFKNTNDITIFRCNKIPSDINIKNGIIYNISLGASMHESLNNKRQNISTPYSSINSIWQKYGKTLVANTPDPCLIWDTINENIIKKINCSTNSTIHAVDYSVQDDIKFSQKLYSIIQSADNTNNTNTVFLKALEYAETIFNTTFNTAILKAKTKAKIEEAITSSHDHIIAFTKYLPWKDFLFNSKNPKAPEIYFVISPSIDGGYTWQCVPKTQNSHDQRKPVPQNWHGLTKKALQEITGVKTATFCHQNGFIGGAETFQDAYIIAQKAARL